LLNLIYLGLIALLSPWLLYQSLRKGKYRQGLTAKLLGLVPRRQGDRFCVWLHAVSVGEVNLIKPLVERIKREHRDWECVISTTTKTGYELARKKYEELQVFYCPLDFSWAAAAAMRRIRPRLFLLAELELWPNLVRAAKRRGVRVGIINGRLSRRSYRGYRWLRPLIAGTLRRLDLIAAQNEEYAERFVRLGANADTVHVTGSVKFDDAQSDRGNPTTQWLRQLAGFRDEDIVFLAGSTQHPEEKAALKTYQQLAKDHPNLRLVLVPRHQERFEEVARLLDRGKIPSERRSQLKGRGVTILFSNRPSARPGGDARREKPSKEGAKRADACPPSGPRVLLVDTIGELGAWWGTADIAFVGGSLGRRGGQNMIEPAAYGAAVSFGPNTRNFRDIVAALRQQKAAVVVKSGKQLTAFVRRCLEQPDYARRLGQRAQAYVARQQGATDRTLRLLEQLAAPARTESRRKAA
jgi:3-deoxy-D-manno-octulosonic-acid transferase